MQLRPYQSTAEAQVYEAWARGVRNVMCVMPTGAGKCLGRGTKILMYDGSVELVENVKSGDLLMGPDSKPRMVNSTCVGREPLYRVTPVKGESYIVNESHILSLKRTGTYKVVNVNVLDYLKSSNNFKHTHKGWRSGVSFSGHLGGGALPAYFLGLWLGDGSSTKPAIYTMDSEVVDYLTEFARDRGSKLHVEDQGENNQSKGYHITNKWVRKGSVMHQLRELDLIGNKHIPSAYKTAYRKDRLALLAGLIDTDGSLSHEGFDITQKSKVLAEDIAFLARSLGLAAYVSECVKVCHNNGVSGTYHRVSISGDCSVVPVRMPHKKAKPRKQKKSVLVTGITLEPIGEGDYFGFDISGDKLFMLGDFTVTHNTALFTKFMADNVGPSLAIAHRQELVSQISMALARWGVEHSIIAPTAVVKLIVTAHMREFGKSFYNPTAGPCVAGVDTLIRRGESFPQFTLWVQDECHHVLKDNKWGKALKMLPNARGLGVTATPRRADGKGLGMHSDGVFEVMIEGPTMRELIEHDPPFLTEYRIFCPPNNLDMSAVSTTAKGEFSKVKMKKAIEKSTVVGNVVEHYLKFARGKLGVTFATDVETATEISAQFNASGVPAEVVSAKTNDRDRASAIEKFKNRELLQLVNVDLFGEGFDLPAIEVISMARPTMSYALFVQQFGRGLRLMDGKVFALIIDHVGNVIRHGLPDAKQEWSLDARERRSSGPQEGVIPITSCLSCFAAYPRTKKACPCCGYYEAPSGRVGIEFVDGDLTELDPSILAEMRAQIESVDMDNEQYRMELMRKNIPRIGQFAMVNKHDARKQSQKRLRKVMAWWAAFERGEGKEDSESYRKFFHLFGSDVVNAQTLKPKEAEKLQEKIVKTFDTLQLQRYVNDITTD